MKSKSFTIGLVLVLAHLPLVAIFFHNYLWPQPQYQFFPIAIAGVAYLIWQSWPREGREAPLQGSRLETLLLMAGIALLASAVALWYAPLAGVAAILSSGGLLLYYAGRQNLRELLPAWAVLWLIIPPPPPWDVQFVQRLQQLASRASSLILDVFGVRHLMEGTVLEFPGRRLLVEEACSGVQSLFALLACTALYLVWARRRFLPAMLLLLAAIFWSAAGNLGRVVTIALAHAWFGVDLSTGWLHELLGFVLFAVALGMLVSTDAVLSFLLGPVYDSPRQPNPNPLSRCWNRLIAGGALEAAAPEGWELGDDEHLVQSPSPAAAQRERRIQAGQSALPGQPELRFRSPRLAATGPFGWWITTGFVAGLAALQLLIVAAMTFRAGEGAPRTRTDLVQRVSNSIGADLLPKDFGGWSRVDYQRAHREVESIFGEFSGIWMYESPASKALVSLDYPFTGWHDLRVCYHNTGWRIVHDREGAARVEQGPNPVGPYWEIAMRKPSGEYAYLWFSLLDQEGQAIAPWSLANRVAPRLKKHPARFLLKGETLAAFDATTYQTQLFVTSDQALTPEEQDRVRGRFFEYRNLLGRVVADAAKAPVAASAGS